MSPRRKIPKNKPRVLPTARDLAADRAAVERCLDRGAKLVARAYRFLESEDFTHLPLSDQAEFKDDLCELEELHKSGPFPSRAARESWASSLS